MILASLSSKAEWDWFKTRTSVILCEDMQGIVAYDDQAQRILGVCVADSFGPDNCNVHIAIDNPAVIRRGFLNEISGWLFLGLNRKRIFGPVPSNNSRARKFFEHIGFTEVAVIPDAVKEGVDYVIYRMDKAGCRWIAPQKEAA
jgi:RimJ/RimL family protein N-acetyltransferase